MADTTVKIDDHTRDILRDLAAETGMSVKDYLARIAEEKQQERLRSTATATFRRLVEDSAFVAAFDAEYGGLPADGHTSRAA